jgi:Cys-tRNA(Pro)/Cys-tRNA(Cys) deacylase
VKELFALTGYVRGGCSPIGMKKHFPTFIDETAQLFDRIFVSAGIRGMQIYINPVDLKNLVEAEFVDLI